MRRTMSEPERNNVKCALGLLRMAYDLRQVGDPGAAEYERDARRALAVALDEEYDLMREEGNRPEHARGPLVLKPGV